MFWLTLLSVLAFIVAPIVLAAVAMSRASRARARVEALEEQLRGVAMRLRQVEIRLEEGGVVGPAGERIESRDRGQAEEPGSGAETGSYEPPKALGTPAGDRAETGTAGSPLTGSAPEREPFRLGNPVTWLLTTLSNGANLARIGAGLILAGVAFFLQYGTEAGLLPQGTRFGAAVLAGVVMACAGTILARRRPTIGRALQGGGIGVIYAALFAGHNLLRLLSSSVAFGSLAGLSLATVALAYLTNSSALAFLALIGGLASPVLVGAGEANLTALFWYYLVLNVAVLAVCVLRGWRAVQAAAFVLTLVTGGVVGGLSFGSRSLMPAEPFLIAFFLIYFASALALAYRYPARPLPLASTVTLPVMTVLLQAGILEEFDFGLGITSAVLALLYLAAGWLLAHSDVPGWSELARAFLPIGTGLAAATLPLLLEPDLTGVVWALQGTSLLWMATRHRRAWLEAFGFVLIGLSALSVLASESWFGMLVWGLSAVAAAWSRRGRAQEELLLLAGGSALLAGSWFTAAEFVPVPFDLGVGLALGATLLLGLNRVGRRLEWRRARKSSALLAALALLGYPFLEGFEVAPLAGVAGLGYLLALVPLLAEQRDSHASPEQRLLPGFALAWGPVIALGMSFYWLSLEFASGGPWWAPSLVVPLAALSVVSLRSSWREAIWGIEPERFDSAVRLPVVVLLAAATLAVCFAPPMMPVSWHLPLINPADLALVLGIWVLALHWTATRSSLDDRRLWGLVALAVLGVSSVMVRVASAHFGMPFTLEAALANTGLQAALSLLWSVLALALLAYSRRRDSRFAWRVGIGLLALTTVKLLVLDLAAAGTLARVVSFVGVGLLFVAVAFLMPVPNRPKDGA